ncbi:MAG: 2'-5' RNA ligase family protein [Bacteroidota bacterium]
MPNKNLLFFALIPFRKLRDQVVIFKQDFAKRFNSYEALKPPVHITIKTPFICNDNAKNELLSWFSELKFFQKQFNIQLKDFAAFPNKDRPVIYINPIETQELKGLQKEFISGFGSLLPAYVTKLDVDFKAHMTVAYRDLSPDMFKKAWSEYQYKSFDAKFEVNAVHLMQHNSKKWELVNSCCLESD